MYFISVTRLRLRSVFSFPAFFIANERSVKELIRTAGLVAGKELIDKGMVFWTVTVWRDMESMKAFRNSTPHRKAMQRLPDWCDEGTYVHWQQEDATIPSWQQVHERMLADGKVSKVRQASARHNNKAFPEPQRTHTQRVFKPAATGNVLP